MTKIPYDEWLNSMGLYKDDKFDEQFINTEQELTNYTISNNYLLQTVEGLGQFIFNEDQFSVEIKLKVVLIILGLSDEKFKRIITNKRIRLGEECKTEYSIKRIILLSKKDEVFKNEILEFLFYGSNSTIGKFAPLYFTRHFRLNESVYVNSLLDHNYMTRLLCDKELFGKYANILGAHVEDKIYGIVDIVNTNGLTIDYQKQKEHLLLEKNVDLVIPNYGGYELLLESSYSNTTSSDQSKRADQIVNMREKIDQSGKKILLLNFCDGLGWYSRKRDLRRIYDSSDYVFNLKNLDSFKEFLYTLKA